MAEEARLESVYTPKAYPEFESRSLRFRRAAGSELAARLSINAVGVVAASGFAETDSRSAEALGRGWGGFVFCKAACGDRGDDCRRRSVKAACGGLAEALGRGWGRGDCFFFLILFLYGSRS